MSEYAKALLLQNDYPEALERLSWILATDPRLEFRNGTEAVRMAERACALTGSHEPQNLATLAAAYAEVGRFSEATATARKAQALAGNTGQKELESKCRRILGELDQAKPWRETVPAGR
jgi:hypothetical protein